MRHAKKDEGKLPQWAQQELRYLRMRIEESDKRAKAWAQQTPTRLSLRNPLEMTERLFMPDATPVRFHFPGPDNWIDVSLRADRISITTGGNDAIVAPVAGNTLEVIPTRILDRKA